MDSPVTIAPDLVVQDQKAEQLARRAASAREPLTAAKRQELKKISRDFEAMFTGMMLKAMRSTVPEDKLTGGGKAEETYRYLLDQEYATTAAQRGGAGSLAAMVEKELLKRYEEPSLRPATRTDGDGQ
ncbi:rod-binding protein [Trichlorobacter ammonificans]|uniref:Flagellar protein FlgJ-like protein n=1 Tax=Trichlorobacter ammonificans TaxID=2916410 RepID=A0ABM9D6I7_9BACT|nr:rod-binding protein [Trichlorobacter ammonificans]CAH2030013.1 Flagellar protein FlgJ-like protein [Trichlorobacter ammonificans]